MSGSTRLQAVQVSDVSPRSHDRLLSDRSLLGNAASAELASLSLRQCTLVSYYYPDSPPDSPTARIPPRLCEPGAFSALSRLDLRLCSLRRDFLPLELLIDSAASASSSSLSGSPPALLPSLRHLLLFTGSHEQSPRTVRAFVRSVAGQLRSLSLDYTAYEILFPAREEATTERTDTGASGEKLIEFPSLRCYGTYWDAAYHTLVGLPLALPALSPLNTLRGPPSAASSQRRSEHRAVPYIHTSIYPAQLDSLAAALESMLTNPELEAANAWTGVAQWRVEGTLRDLDLAELDAERGDDPGLAPARGGTDDSEEELEDEEEGEDSTGPTRRRGDGSLRRHRTPETAFPPRREPRTASLVRLAREHARLDLQVEVAGKNSFDADLTYGSSSSGAEPARTQAPTDGRLRATFERGFGTSWWRFVNEVERDELL